LQDNKKNKKGDGFWGNVRTVVYALLIAIAIRTVAYEPFSIPSGSMIPTLEIGDYLFVSKYSYGYSRYSLPFGLPLIKDRIFYTEPERGDVVVFKLPSDNSTDYIKRIIGLPGDKVQVKEGRLYINGNMLERKELRKESNIFPDGSRRMVTVYEETLPEGKVHLIQEISDKEAPDNTPVYAVPEDHFFMMGDNRDNSMDSRFANVGAVPKINLEGKALRIFFSSDGSGWWKFWNWWSDIRFSRFFQSIN